MKIFGVEKEGKWNAKNLHNLYSSPVTTRTRITD
jgi:hypothetical protein